MNQQSKHPTVSQIGGTPVADPPVAALAPVVPSHAALPASLPIQSYPWFSTSNQQKALVYQEERRLASEQRLYHQVGLIEQQIVRLFCMDSADRTEWLVYSQLGYRGPRHHHRENGPVPERRCFWASSQNYLSKYVPIEEFQDLIPPEALRAQATIEQAGIYPQAYWIVTRFNLYRDKANVILTVQFGREFVSIYSWP